MSIRAYITKRIRVESNNENYDMFKIYREKNCMFNITHTTQLLNLFEWYGYNATNYDWVGELELLSEQFEDFMKEKKENTKNWTDYDLEVLDKIKKYFDEGNEILTLECY